MLSEQVKEALARINFVERYQGLCERYNRDILVGKEKLDVDYDNLYEAVGDLIDIFDYDDDEYICIAEPEKYNIGSCEYMFSFYFSVWGSKLKAALHIEKDGVAILDGGEFPFEGVLQVLTRKAMPDVPFFTSYDDIRAIMTELAALYEDVKKEILSQAPVGGEVKDEPQTITNRFKDFKRKIFGA